MKYIEGIDYWVRYVPFPNMASESVVASHGDGTFTIYINTLFCPERQEERRLHELRHLTQEHFYRDDLPLVRLEHQADGLPEDTEVRLLPGPAPAFSVFRSPALPEGVHFAFRVPDESMQPYCAAGSILHCDGEALRSGDVGLFQYGGATLCRQYHTDRLGMTYLFALDRRRAAEDVVLSADRRRELVCLGRVRMDAAVPLPGR